MDVFIRKNILVVLALPALGAVGVGVYARLVRERVERKVTVQDSNDGSLLKDKTNIDE